MTKKTNILYNSLTYLFTLALFVLVTIFGEKHTSNFWALIVTLVVGAIVSGLVITFFHELGHVIAGKKNGFAFVSMQVLCFKWTKEKKKIKFSFAMLGNQAGFTEMVPTSLENMEKRYANMTKGGFLSTILPIAFGLAPLFISSLSLWAFSIWVMFLPVGVYSLCDNAFPMLQEGFRNDGAVLLGLKRNDDSSKVMVSLLKVQSEMYNGKTPAEVDEKLYFDLPQLPEDDVNFFMLLNARYNYYLDKKDFDNAKKTTERLLSLEEYFPKEYLYVAKADALYNACTFDFNEKVADDLTYELEHYLNSVNNCTNIRIKLAYILFVKGERDCFELFYKKGNKEALKCQIKGLAKFEQGLLEEIKVKHEQQN